MRRSVPKLVIGIILTVIGALLLLGRVTSPGAGVSEGPSDPAELAGYLTATVLFVVLPLGIGILLIATSKRKG